MDQQERIEQYAEELLVDYCNVNNLENWYEGLSECGYGDADYPTPSHAPMEVVERVAEYWYNVAIFLAKRKL